MARNAGTVAMGSTITKRELKASTPYSIGVMRSSHSGLSQQLCPRIGVRAFGQSLEKSSFVFRHGRRNHYLQNQEEISISSSGLWEALIFEPELALRLAAGGHLHLDRLGQ